MCVSICPPNREDRASRPLEMRLSSSHRSWEAKKLTRFVPLILLSIPSFPRSFSFLKRETYSNELVRKQEIDVAIVKATNHDQVPPKEKHVRSKYSYATNFVEFFFPRLEMSLLLTPLPF